MFSGAFAVSAGFMMREIGAEYSLVEQTMYSLATIGAGAFATGLGARSLLHALDAHRLHQRANSLEDRAERDVTVPPRVQPQ